MDVNFIQPKNNFKWLKFAGATILILFAAGAVVSAFYFYKKYSSVKTVADSAAANQSVVDAVGKLIELPNETPTIATVTDPSKLSGQQFFDHAKVGDKVLIFVNAKKAILYDPNEGKLVEVAPLNLDDANAPAVSGTKTDTKQ